MGEVFRPEDVAKGRRKLFREAVRDLSPDLRDAIWQIIESWEGMESQKKLVRLLGEEKAKHFLRKLSQF